MFSLYSSDNRYVANCIVNRNKPKVRRFVMDTGELYTCCSYDYIDPDLREEDFIDKPSKLMGGFVADVGMKFYECTLKQFTIVTVNCGEQRIWITFDPRIAESLLGMDILSQVFFVSYPNIGEIVLYDSLNEAAKDIVQRADSFVPV